MYIVDLVKDSYSIKVLSDATWFEKWLPSIIEILGIIATLFGVYIVYRSIRTTMKSNIEQQKAERLMQKTEQVPELILNMLNKMEDGKTSKLTEQLQQIYSIVYAYGSVDAIKITVAMQKIFIQNNKQKSSTESESESERLKPLCYMSLLISQIKLDVTGEAIHPINWFDLKINNLSETTREESIVNINEIVTNLKLNPRLLQQ